MHQRIKTVINQFLSLYFSVLSSKSKTSNSSYFLIVIKVAKYIYIYLINMLLTGGLHFFKKHDIMLWQRPTMSLSTSLTAQYMC